jgi:hypothetical protein
MKSRINSGNACHHSVLSLSSSSLLPVNVKIKIYKKTYSSHLVCVGVILSLSHEGKSTDWGCLRTGRIFGPKQEAETGDWRKLHNGELHNLYSSQSNIRRIKPRRMRSTGHEAIIGGERNVYTLLVGMSEWKRPLEGPRRKWEDGITLDLRKIG